MEKLSRKVLEVSVSQTREISSEGLYVNDDIVLFNKFEDVPLPTELSRMNCFFIALCQAGKARYTIDTHEQVVGKNDLIIVNNGQIVGDYMLSLDCRGLAIMGSSDFFQELIKDFHELSRLFLFMRNNPVVHLSDEEADIFKAYFNTMQQRIILPDHHFRRQVISNLFRAMIYDVGDRIWHAENDVETKVQTRAESIFADFVYLVEQNFREQRRVAWYGEQLCITPKYLSEMVKAASGETPNEWIEKYVVLELRLLLKNTTLSVKEITKKMNFPNQSFLGKYFKEHVGVSPSDYRRNVK